MFRRIGGAATASAFFLLTASGGDAQPYPNRQITMIVPFGVGGPVDNSGRAFAEAMRRALSQTIVIDNRPGAGGIVGSKMVASAKPDGYTLLIGSPGPLIISPAAGAAGVDIDKDLTAVGMIGESAQILAASPVANASTLAELIAFVRASNGTLNYGSGGIGTMPHLAMEMMKREAKLDITHIPYRSTAAGLPDLISGRTALSFGDITAMKPQVDAGRIKGIAVTSTKRSDIVPSLPTMAEAGMAKVTTRNWQALMGPAGLPDDVVKRLGEAMKAAAGDAAYVEVQRKQGVAVTDSAQAHLMAQIKSERAWLEPLVKSIGLKLE